MTGGEIQVVEEAVMVQKAVVAAVIAAVGVEVAIFAVVAAAGNAAAVTAGFAGAGVVEASEREAAEAFGAERASEAFEVSGDSEAPEPLEIEEIAGRELSGKFGRMTIMFQVMQVHG